MLLRFQPLDKHTIQAWWYDEKEEYHENAPVNLFEYLSKLPWFQMAGRISEPRKA